MKRSSPGWRIAGFGLIQTSATVEGGFGPEHYVSASGVFHPRKQRIANDGT